MSTTKLAFIFDMDGVVVDSIPYHKQIWRNFVLQNHKKFSDHFFDTKINARRGLEIMRTIFGPKPTDAELKRLDQKREILWRTLFAAKARPLLGLTKFLAAAKRQKIPLALATSAPPENVALVLRKTKLAPYFDYIIDASGVKRGKPHPDIFLKAARKLKITPKNCVVFEDAPNGVAAARRARMRVVAVTTTYTKNQLPQARWYIKNFVGLKPKKFL